GEGRLRAGLRGYGVQASLPPRSHTDPCSDRERRSEHRRDPAAVDRVLEEEPGCRQQGEHPYEKEPALAEPLFEILGRWTAGGRRATRGWTGVWRRFLDS